ncbi:MAG TPA: hypothetical protein VD902_05425 [Symbiobacteriaceae bacterium]|nr:hypothetical protein [Symbiobacteriaceae bacterium]
MDTEPIAPEQSPSKASSLVVTALKGAGALALVAAVAAGAAWSVFSYRMQSERQGTADQVAALRQEIRTAQDDLSAKVQQVEDAAREAKLLMDQSGQTATLDARLQEIDTLRLEVKKTRDDMDAKLQSLEKSVVEQVAKQGKDTAQALALELRWKTLLVKAQGEVLLAQIQWAEGNRGLAKDELAIAAGTLLQAYTEAPEAVKADLKPVVDLAEQTKAALILEQASARDSLNMLWHRVSDLLGMAQKQ